MLNFVLQSAYFRIFIFSFYFQSSTKMSRKSDSFKQKLHKLIKNKMKNHKLPHVKIKMIVFRFVEQK